MRGFGWAALGAALLVASSAHAVVIQSCGGGCLTDPFGTLIVDYTVPADGQSYRWDLWSDSSHPNVLINLGSPNDAFDVDTVSNGGGVFHTTGFLLGAPFTWNEVQDPGHTTIFARSLNSNFNHCSSASPAGDVCAASFNIFGDSVTLSVNTQDSVRIFFAGVVVPEPATWTMTIAGFFGLGMVLRRRRSTRVAA
jgi:hypothetical protein